jgi:hypothetical protein
MGEFIRYGERSVSIYYRPVKEPKNVWADTIYIDVLADTNFIVTFENCIITQKEGRWFYYTESENIVINVKDKTPQNRNFRMKFNTALPGIGVDGGYIPQRSHYPPARLTDKVTLDCGISDRGKFSLISCTITVSCGKKMFENIVFCEDITNGRITNYQEFKDKLCIGAYIYYDNIIVQNSRGTIFRLNNQFTTVH